MKERPGFPRAHRLALDRSTIAFLEQFRGNEVSRLDAAVLIDRIELHEVIIIPMHNATGGPSDTGIVALMILSIMLKPATLIRHRRRILQDRLAPLGNGADYAQGLTFEFAWIDEGSKEEFAGRDRIVEMDTGIETFEIGDGLDLGDKEGFVVVEEFKRVERIVGVIVMPVESGGRLSQILKARELANDTDT
jgi:hypothetical protein